MKYIKRVASVLLSLSLSLTCFSGAAFAQETSRVLYETDFSQSDGHIVREAGFNNFIIDDGVFRLTREEGTNKNFPDKVRFYVNEEKTVVRDGKICVEFKAMRSAEKKMSYDLCDSYGNIITSVHFQNNGDISVYYKSEQEAAAKDTVVFFASPVSEFVDVKVSFNQALKTVEVFFADGITPCARGYYAQEAEDFSYIELNVRAGNYHTVTMDDLKISVAEQSTSESVYMDEMFLTYESFGKELPDMITGSFALPDTGKYGSRIINWVSSNPSVITIDNYTAVVTRQSENIPVTLTATITDGTVSVSKTLEELTVLKQGIIAPPGAPDGYILSESLKGEALPSFIKVKTGAPTPTSDGVLISKGDSFEYYLNGDKTGIGELAAISYKLSGDGTTVNYYDDRDTVVLSIKTENDTLFVYNKSGDDLADIKETAYYSDIKRGLFNRDITLLFEPVTGIFTIWYDGDKIAQNRLSADKCSKISRLEFIQSDKSSAVSDAKVFLPSVADEDAVKMDKLILQRKGITWQNTERISVDIDLPTVMDAGSRVEWSTSNENAVVVPDGKVKLTGESATLTATLIKGEKRETASFNLKTISANEAEMPVVGEVIAQDKFSNNTVTCIMENLANNGELYFADESTLLCRHIPDVGDNTELNIFFDEKKTVYKGVYALEFTLNREGTEHDVNILGDRASSSTDYFYLSWKKNGTILLNGDYKETDKAKQQTYIKDESGRNRVFSGAVRFKILVDTNNSVYSVWIDNELVVRNRNSRFAGSAGVKRLRVFVAANAAAQSPATVKLDNFKAYRSLALEEDRINFDYDWLDAKILVSTDDKANIIAPTYVSEKLSLPETGYFGSKIEWASTNENAIALDGSVTRSDTGQEVTLTATISATVYAVPRTKTFTFYVPGSETDSTQIVNKDLQLIEAATLSPYDNPDNGIIRSLNLPSEGIYGSKIVYTSSNEKVITKSGRVIRPKAGEGDKKVIITATFTKDGVSAEKTFEFTVLQDIAFADPNHMSDEEFFGKWNSSLSKWDIESKLDYSYDGMEKVGSAVKNNDYDKAKEELLTYFKNRTPKSSISLSKRNTGWAEMVTDGFLHLQQSAYYKGSMTVGATWNEYSASITPTGINESGIMAYTVRSWYNESNYVDIARANDPDVSKRPRLEIVVNGAKKEYIAIDDAMVAAGVYSKENFGSQQYIRVQNYGDFLDSKLSQAYLKFDVSDLNTDMEITEARLYLYAKSGPQDDEKKRLIILYEPDDGWTREETVWNTTNGYIYSYNGFGRRGEEDSGLPDGGMWTRPEGSDIEYWNQFMRFYCWPTIAAEYAVTKNEDYAYKAQRILESFLIDTGGYLSSEPNFNNDTVNGIRGGYISAMVTAIRNTSWVAAFPIFMKSDSATPDFCTAWLKAMCDASNFISTHPDPVRNAAVTEFSSLINLALKIPEFAQSDEWLERAKTRMTEVILENTNSDGSYIESNDGYASGVLSGFVDFKNNMKIMGEEVGEVYDARLKAFAYYQALLYATDGTSPQWGDSGLGVRSASIFTPIYTWDDDKELQYIITYGAKGVEPSWTSRLFPDSTVATLRASWSKNSPWLFTNARGGGGHGHNDFNSIVLHAYGRTLLNDSGYFSYDGENEYNAYGKSTKAHNTVLVNDISQQRKGDMNDGAPTNGVTHGFSTNKYYDYLSQSTPSNTGVDHRRTISYIKPNIFIVSDLMTPENKTKANNYKQIWHMHPEANIIVSDDGKYIRSNFGDGGGEVILASADSNEVNAVKELGWCARRYAKAEEAPFGYFEKNTADDAKLDTVIMTYAGDSSASVSAQRIATNNENASALCIDIIQKEKPSTGYYYVSYNNAGGTFGEFSTDAHCAYIQYSQSGNIESIMLRNGTWIKKGTEIIFQSTQKQDDVFINMQGSNTYIEGDIAKLSDARIRFTKNSAGKLFVSNTAQSYTLENGIIKDIGSGSVGAGTATEENKNVENVIGGVSDGSNGGGGGGGGSSSEEKPPKEDKDGENKENVSQQPIRFGDVSGHWAEKAIEQMLEKGIFNGDTDGNFHPDRNITRAEFLTVAVRSQEWKEKSYRGRFKDVGKNDWYADVIQTALDNDIISSDDLFRPNEPITRQEMAKIISKITSQERTETGIDIKEIYDDFDSIAQWAIEFVQYVTDCKIMKGRENGDFAPFDNATRAEAATVMSRIIAEK